MVISTAPETLEIPTGDDIPVRADLYWPRGRTAAGVALLCHGFKGYKTWGFLPYLAGALKEAGIGALSLDMSHNGTFPVSDGGRKSHQRKVYIRPDLFETNTLHREYEDMAAVIRFVSQGGLKQYTTDPIQIGLFGHSRGGIAATLNAIDHAEAAVLCTWSMPDDADHYTDAQKERWRRDGKLAFEVQSEGTRLEISVAYLDDLEENHGFYHLRERVRELKVPHLIVHGKVDLTVPFTSALSLHEAERHLRDKELLVLQTGHTFGVDPLKHGPIKKPSRALSQAVQETVVWFRDHLREEVKG